MNNQKELSLILLNIRSVYNVGSMFRTADAAGVSKIYLVGETATPVDRFGRDRADIAKTALGAEKIVPWEYFSSVEDLFKKLRDEDVDVIALEQDERSVNYKEYEFARSAALIVGNEPIGIDKEVLDECDHILEIPMRGSKESLNVSVATGIAVYEILG